ncbi:MAG TPA: 50S ribosomal protein L25 [Acidimicrobiales bacterium]|nr:50S ribosomal protein L25 [Acidimicrobiales bacterium]
MPDITLVAEPGRPSGSSASRRLRAAGRIPAVVYGHGIEPISVSVDSKDLRHALGSEAGARALLRLAIGDGEHLAMARQLQRDPVRHTVVHVDFQVVSRDEVLTADIPIVLVGEAEAVNRNDGTVDQEMQSLGVKAKPGDLPPYVEVDISNLEIGDSIRAGDVVLPAGVELDGDPDSPIAVAHVARAALVEVAAPAAEGEGEGEEPAEVVDEPADAG